MVDEQEDTACKHEQRFAALERNVAIIHSNYATKEDLIRMETRLDITIGQLDLKIVQLELRLVKWIMGALAGSLFAALAAAANLLKLFGG